MASPSREQLWPIHSLWRGMAVLLMDCWYNHDYLQWANGNKDFIYYFKTFLLSVCSEKVSFLNFAQSHLLLLTGATWCPNIGESWITGRQPEFFSQRWVRTLAVQIPAKLQYVTGHQGWTTWTGEGCPANFSKGCPHAKSRANAIPSPRLVESFEISRSHWW